MTLWRFFSLWTTCAVVSGQIIVFPSRNATQGVNLTDICVTDGQGARTPLGNHTAERYVSLLAVEGSRLSLILPRMPIVNLQGTVLADDFSSWGSTQPFWNDRLASGYGTFLDDTAPFWTGSPSATGGSWPEDPFTNCADWTDETTTGVATEASSGTWNSASYNCTSFAHVLCALLPPPPTPPTGSPTATPTTVPSTSPSSTGITSIPLGSTQTVMWDGGTDVTVTVPFGILEHAEGDVVTVLVEPKPIDSQRDKDGAAGVMLSINLLINSAHAGRVNLSSPITFELPLPPSAECAIPPSCGWWNEARARWETSGCSATTDTSAKTVVCTCTHLTDFAVLLSAKLRKCTKPPFASYYLAVVAYGMVFAYSAVLTGLLATRKRLNSPAWVMLLRQHGLIALAAAARLLSSLQSLQVFGDVSHVVVALVTALPFQLEVWLFSAVILMWARLLHFAMNPSSTLERAMRIGIAATNAVEAVAVVTILVFFLAAARSLAPTLALAGTFVVSLMFLLLGVGFAVYSRALSNTLQKATSGNSSTVALARKILRLGGGLALCFFVQCVFSLVAVGVVVFGDNDHPDSHAALEALTACFVVFDVAGFVCCIGLYFNAARALLAQKQKAPELMRLESGAQ